MLAIVNIFLLLYSENFLFMKNPIDVSDLLPQKYPFKMVDFLQFADENNIETSFAILPENVLQTDSFFTEGGMLENIAQSAAAGTGYFLSQQKKDIPVGYIGAIKHVKISQLPKVNDTIHTFIETKNKIGNASIVEGKIFLQKNCIASCELTIFVQQNESL